MQEWLDRLWQALDELPELLQDRDGWQDLEVVYEQPRVERLYRPHEDGRIMLHRIHPIGDGQKPLLHPHPWPSATLIVSGNYEMQTGLTDPITGGVHQGLTLHLAEGSFYVMDRPDQWHSVNPVGEPSYSIMVLGRPWEWSSYHRAVQADILAAPTERQPRLAPEVRSGLFEDFERILELR